MSRETLLAGFAATDFLTPKRVVLLRAFFGNLNAAWENNDEENLVKSGISLRSARSFLRKKKESIPEKIWDTIQKADAKLLFYEDKNFPPLLKTIASPPAILFVRGEVSILSAPALAVVGTRALSLEGKTLVENLVPDLVAQNLVITSGLARGADAAAHRATLSKNGKTIAVLGNGIGAIYPPEHRNLAKKIEENGGAIVSEFIPGISPKTYHFPRRNRIVAGMTLGTLIVEGAEKSGSLITAQFAVEENREVFALPGSPRAPLSAGPNRLIQKGLAKLVLNAEDILCELPIPQNISKSKTQIKMPNDPTEKKIIEYLKNDQKNFDDIVRSVDISPAALSASLTILEMKGFVIAFGGNMWARK